MEGTKKWFQSTTILAILVMLLERAAALFLNYAPELQAQLEALIPAPWNAFVAPAVAAIIILLGIIGIKGRVKARKQIG